VLNDHYRNLKLAVQPHQSPHNGLSPLAIQIGRRLIKDQGRGPHREAGGNGDSLLLAPGEMAH
jgi:hypothetical protein